jgi:hypothetical protein
MHAGRRHLGRRPVLGFPSRAQAPVGCVLRADQNIRWFDGAFQVSRSQSAVRRSKFNLSKLCLINLNCADALLCIDVSIR